MKPKEIKIFTEDLSLDLKILVCRLDQMRPFGDGPMEAFNLSEQRLIAFKKEARAIADIIAKLPRTHDPLKFWED